MTTKKTTPTKSKTPKPPFVVFGLDENGKTKGARFPAEQLEQASHACNSMRLELHEASTDELLELAKKLPSGRIYARGRAFVPFIKRELHDRLRAATGGRAQDPTDPSQSRSTGKSAAVQDPTETALPQLPLAWDAVEPGQVVLAKSAVADEGYFEAVILSRQDDVLTLKYRDYPNERPIERTVAMIGLLNPTPQQAT